MITGTKGDEASIQRKIYSRRRQKGHLWSCNDPLADSPCWSAFHRNQSASLYVDRLKFFGCHLGTSIPLPKFQFCPLDGLQKIKSHAKANFLGELEHVVGFWQDKPENTLKTFLPADVDKKVLSVFSGLSCQKTTTCSNSPRKLALA